MTETNRDELYAMVYETVRDIPEGNVATYGQIAKLMGLPRHARHVGFALANLSNNHNVPWHRVVNARGQLHQRRNSTTTQRQLLVGEGITFTTIGNVNLKKHQWSQV